MHDEKTTVTILPPIEVRSLYSNDMRQRIRTRLEAIRGHYQIGMIRFHAEIVGTVAVNKARIVKPDRSTGLYVDQLSVKNLYHFFDGIRSDDSRVQILDAYLQITNEMQDAV